MPDDSIVVAGASSAGRRLILVAVRADGRTDRGFGIGGLSVLGPGHRRRCEPGRHFDQTAAVGSRRVLAEDAPGALRRSATQGVPARPKMRRAELALVLGH